MKATLMICAATLALGACASPRGPMGFLDDGLDHARMSDVERAVNTRNGRVLWVNPPLRTAPLPVVPVTGEDRA